MTAPTSASGLLVRLLGVIAATNGARSGGLFSSTLVVSHRRLPLGILGAHAGAARSPRRSRARAIPMRRRRRLLDQGARGVQRPGRLLPEHACVRDGSRGAFFELCEIGEPQFDPWCRKGNRSTNTMNSSLVASAKPGSVTPFNVQRKVRERRRAKSATPAQEAPAHVELPSGNRIPSPRTSG